MGMLRRIVEEYEARLSPPEDRLSAPKGKSERKRYGDRQERLKVTARNLDLPDGVIAQIVVNDQVQGERPVTGGRIRLDVTSPSHPVPRVSTGDVIQVKAAGEVHLAGTYRPD